MTTNQHIVTHDRTAGSAIRGYKYQFDKTIIELINADHDTDITIEGIEDYDRSSQDVCESVQVKYLQAQSFSLALIRGAIVPMLANSVTNLDRRYKLYIHCGDLSKFSPKLDLDSLKNCLTEKPRGKPPIELFKDYSDDQLNDFCTRLTLESGRSYEEQRRQTTEVLMREFGCSEEDCNDLFLPASRDVVSEIAIRTSLVDRSLSKKEFVGKINRRHRMYTRWHAKHVGEERFIAAICKRVKSARAISPTKHRLVLLDEENLGFDQLVSIASRLSINYTEKSLANARPWTIVADVESSTLTSLKIALVRAGIRINDGWEHLSFVPEEFNSSPIINTRGKAKFIEVASFSLRVISHDAYAANQGKLLQPHHVFSACNQTVPGFEDTTFYLTHLPVERIYQVLGI